VTLVHQARVDAAGKLTLVNPETFRRAMREFAEAPVELTVRRLRKRRSDRQHRYYFGVVVAMLAEFTGYTSDEMHDALKWKFLRVDPESSLPTVRSTTSLTTVEFEDFLERVRTWAAADVGVVIPLPNEAEAD
jgi:hypothetical protein